MSDPPHDSGWPEWLAWEMNISSRSALWLLGGVLVLWISSVLTYGCCTSLQTGSFYEPITISSIAWNRKKDWRMLVNYAMLLPLHFLRSMETASGDKNVYSSTEKAFLATQRRVFNDAVINFLTVRRSMMFVSVVFCVLAFFIEAADVPAAMMTRKQWIHKSRIEIDGNVVRFPQFVLMTNKTWNTKDPEAWFAYSKHLYTGMFAKIISQTAMMDILQAVLEVACQGISCYLLWWSLRKWSHFNRSHRGVLTGWAFSLVAPFLATVIPTRLFVDWTVLDPVVHTFASELSQHMGNHTEDLASTVNQACLQLIHMEAQGTVENAESFAMKTCSTLKMTPNRHLKCCSFIKLVDFDFRPIHSTCDKVEDYLKQPDRFHKQAIEQSTELCRTTVMPNLKGTIELGFENALQVAASAGPIAQRMKQSVSMGMGLVNGLRGFNTIMPAALALAPALLRGALKVKVTAPQSTIPGMFVVVLPLLYCPMTWGMYHIFFQLLGDFWMLLGLLVMAFGPMVYLALGSYYTITRPLTDKAVAQVMVSMNRASTILAIIGYVFICTFAWKRYKLTIGEEESEDDASVERDAYKYIAEQVSVLQPSFWIKLAGVAMAKYFFTTLAGVDWMMVEIGKQRRYEILMEISQKIKALETSGTAVRYPQGLKTEVERQENLQAAEERLLRLDCVFYILYDEVPVHVVEEEDINPHMPSMRRRTTVLAPAVSRIFEEVEMQDVEQNSKNDETTSGAGVPTPLPSQIEFSESQPRMPQPQDVADARGEPPRPSTLDNAWSFFFGLRVPNQSRPQARSLAAPRPAQGWPPPPTSTVPGSQSWRPQTPLASDWAQGVQYHPTPHFAANSVLPAQWQASLGPPSGSWSRHTVAPGQHMRPQF
ncbi:ABCF2 [Symbiodinium sp. CCMP2456]|nr:ABCF2 [Symbiodinium sp. CCMP2456]